MIKCPNKNLPEWKRLVTALGEINAYKVYIHNKEEVPDMVKTDEYIQFYTQRLYPENVDYNLKALDILISDKAKQVFDKGNKVGWDLNKILTELQVPKEQKQLILDRGFKVLTDNDARLNNEPDLREQIITDLLANYSYTVEINTATSKGNKGATLVGIEDININGNIYRTELPVIVGDNEIKYFKNENKISKEEYDEAVKISDTAEPTQFYSNLTVPGGTNYTENEIAIPGVEVEEVPEGNIVKQGVLEIFDKNPELASIGTPEQYSQYLDTIFPDSKVKDIVTHNSPNKFDKFKTNRGRLGLGVYFGLDYKIYTSGKYNYKAVLNITNLKRYDKGEFVITANRLYPSTDEYSTKPQDELRKSDENQGVDGYVSTSPVGTEYLVFEPEQIHILGSKQDIEGFNKWIKSNTKTVRKGAITPSIKGHAQFSTDNGVGWFRSDEQVKDLTTSKTRLTVSQEGSDGFGYVLGLFNFNQERIGKIVYRSKTYLKEKGFPIVNELHLGFEEAFQRKGYFQDALIELLNYDDPPIFISNGRVINNNVFKAINKLDDNKLNITKIEDGYIITLNNNPTKTRRILEVQSDLFQKGRDKKDLIGKITLKEKANHDAAFHNAQVEWEEVQSIGESNFSKEYIEELKSKIDKFKSIFKENLPENQFLQLLNKDNNWVTFFVKSIIQDSAKKGYEKVLFPKGDTASKIEGHSTLEEFKKQKEDRIKELEEDIKNINVLLDKKVDAIGNPFEEGQQQDYENKIIQKNNEINQLKQELERVEKEGFGALKPIYNFYENTVANILKKQGYSPTIFVDEYGNTWNEVILNEDRDLKTIQLQKVSFVSKPNTSNLDTDVNYQRKKTKLLKIFDKLGIPVTVTEKEEGNYYSVNSKGNVTINIDPRKRFKDSLLHEFGHLYVDILGLTNPTIQKGIESLSGTVLWGKIATIYPELSEQDLAKEVLTTAIGMEASDIFDEAEQQSRWKYWLNRLYRAISEFLGLNGDSVKQLARELVTGNLQPVIDSRLSETLQWQKDETDLQNNQNIMNYLDNVRKSLEQDKGRLKNKVKAKEYLGRVDELNFNEQELNNIRQDLVNNLNLEQRRVLAGSLVKTFNFELRNLMQLEKSVVKLENYYKTNNPDFYSNETRELVYILNEIRLFIGRMTLIEGIDVREFNKIDKPDSEKTDAEKQLEKLNSTIEKLIKNSKGYLDRISNLKNKYDKLEKTYAGTVIKLSNNPEFRDFYNDVIDGSFKELKTSEYYFDSIFYSENPFLANIAKAYEVGKRINEKKSIEIINDWFDNWKKFKDAGFTVSDIIDSDTNDLIQKYDHEGYNQALEDFYKSIENLPVDSVERYKAIQKFNRENKQQRYISAVANAESKLSQEAYDFVLKIRFEQRQILSKYNRREDKVTKKRYKGQDISIEDRQTLAELKWQRNYFSNVKNFEEGTNEYRLAKELSDYFEFMSDKFDSKLIIPFKEVKDEFNLLKTYSEERRNISLQRNFRPSNIFMTKFNSIISVLSGNKSKNKELKKLTDKYKDDQGRIIGSIVPTDVKAKIKELAEEKPTDVDGNIISYDTDPPIHIKNALKALEESVDFQPTEYYYQDYKYQFDKYKKRSKKKNPTEKDFKKSKWYKENHYINPYTGEIQPLRIWTTIMPKDLTLELESDLIDGKIVESYTGSLQPGAPYTISEIKEEYINENAEFDNYGRPYPNRKWLTDNYIKLQSKPQAFEFWNYLTDLTVKLLPHLNHDKLKTNLAPIGTKKYYEQGKRQVSDKELIDITGQKIFIPYFKFLGKLGGEKLIPLRRKLDTETQHEYEESVLTALEVQGYGTFESIDQIRDKNKEIRKINNDRHKEAINLNLEETYPIFIKEALLNRYKSENIDKFSLALSAIRNMKIEKDGIIDKQLSKIKGTEEKLTISGENSKIYKRWEKFIEQEMMGEYLKYEGLQTEIGEKFKNYVSLLSLGFNVFAGVKNITYGNTQMIIEGNAGVNYTNKDARKGVKFYFEGVSSYGKDLMLDNPYESTTLQNGLIKYFDVQQDTRELADDITDSSTAQLAKEKVKKLGYAAAYGIMNIGEHQMQNQGLFTMMFSHRLIDGKIMNLREYKERIYKPTRQEVEQDSKLLSVFEEQIDKATKKFETYPTLIDIYELKEGLIKVKDDYEVSDIEDAKFRRKVMAVNHQLHGIYNRMDKGVIENTIKGQLFMQFRHWFMPSWNRRFGQRFGEEVYNESLGYTVGGDYMTTWRLLTKPVKEAYVNTRGEDTFTNFMLSGQFMEFAKAAIANYTHFIKNAQLYWFELNDVQKGEVKRAATELGFIIILMAAIRLLKGFADDDEELKSSYFYNFMMYQTDGLLTELSTYTPVGWINESNKLIQNPMATFKTMQELIKLGYLTTTYPINNVLGEDEKNYYRGGPRHGELKMKVTLTKLVPLAKQLDKWYNLEDNNKFYKLYY